MLRILLLFVLLGIAAAVSNKVDVKLAKTLRTARLANVFVKFGNGNEDVIRDINSQTFPIKLEKVEKLISGLKKLTEQSQSSTIEFLKSSKFGYSPISFQQLWITNELYISGADVHLIRQLASFPEVSEIREELIVSVAGFEEETTISQQSGWNLERIKVEEAWIEGGGRKGDDVVVGTIDTGVRATHAYLVDKYRTDSYGEYGWFDAIETPPRVEPSDSHGIGTFMTGIIVGDNVGIAPNAKWISCSACNIRGLCPELSLINCGQWMIEPTKRDGSGADFMKHPNYVTGSWGTQGSNMFYNHVLSVWIAVDIIPVFSVGAYGQFCASVGSPGDQTAAIGTAATTPSNGLMDRSSMGPSYDDRIKPEISATGKSIRSTWSSSDYAVPSLSATAFSASHVAGVAALVVSNDMDLTFNQVKDILFESADRSNLEPVEETCGGIPITEPNYSYGYGLLQSEFFMRVGPKFSFTSSM